MSSSPYFLYGEQELQYLKSKDPILGAAIDEIGWIKRPVIPDLFMALLNSIVGQQISTKALATIWERMQERLAPLNAKHLITIPTETLQSCGMSMRKAIYIKDIATMVEDGRLDLESLTELSDDDVCKTLCNVKGIGTWTAEMIMTFSMQRKNIMSWDDLAIHRGLRMLYHHRKITRTLFAKYKKKYAPYATIASIYLWAIAGGACKDLHDYAPKTKSKKNAKMRKEKKTT